MLHPIYRRSAVEMVQGIQAGDFTSVEVVESCLGRIEDREPTIAAWESLNPAAVAQAASAGALRGVPVGIKDLIDTGDLPTGYGSRAFAGHRPARDAACVARIRAAGGVILGKTVTTEFAASYEAVRTRNPWDPSRTPGGSSSGSAAAVADQMVPVAVGTQTGGSVLRPASFCGIFGYKPTFGAISRAGVHAVSPTLDTVGIFARALDDIALLARILAGRDPADAATLADAIDYTNADRPMDRAPRVALIQTPWIGQADDYVAPALGRLAEAMGAAGASVREISLPASFNDLVAAAALVMDVEGARELGPISDATGLVGEGVNKLIAAGRAWTDRQYEDALHLGLACRAELLPLLASYDIALLPVAKGEAPSRETTGDPLFCRPWTMLGLPTISVPGLVGPHGLPLGVQLMGRHREDGALLQAARWAVENVSALGSRSVVE
jgi:Asp-tRNA(Asn)/Glu-tRNA(Gln) amidotransferase A subunit family amidase